MPKNVKKILIHFQLIKDTFQVDNKPIIKWQKYAIFFHIGPAIITSIHI